MGSKASASIASIGLKALHEGEALSCHGLFVTGCPWQSSWARASNAWWPHGRQQGEWGSCVLIAGTSEPDPDQMETSSPGLTASGAMVPAVGGTIRLLWGSPGGPVVSEGRFGGAAWGRGLGSLAEETPSLWHVGCKTRWGGEVHIYRKEGNTRGWLPAWRPWLIVVVTLPWRKARQHRTK